MNRGACYPWLALSYLRAAGRPALAPGIAALPA
jgi:hypothetical protein